MTVVEAYVGEKNIAGASNASSLSPTVNSLILEGIAQNTTGNVYEPEVTLYISLYFHFFYGRIRIYTKPSDFTNLILSSTSIFMFANYTQSLTPFANSIHCFSYL